MRRARLARLSPNRRDVMFASKIEMESEENTLRFRCPDTGRTVDSDISTRGAARLISVRVQCPICENIHEWRVADGGLGTDLSADPQSNDARLNTPETVFQPFPGPSAEMIELRDQLLDEFNHRLKSNLQVLYGLLKQACRKTDNTEARGVLSDTCGRIGAMERSVVRSIARFPNSEVVLAGLLVNHIFFSSKLRQCSQSAQLVIY